MHGLPVRVKDSFDQPGVSSNSVPRSSTSFQASWSGAPLTNDFQIVRRTLRPHTTPTPNGRDMDRLEELNLRIIACTRCPRLVEHRQSVARTKRRMYREHEYWGRPLTGFGDPEARVLLVGLAPAAHGGNRTGRMFTGDRSGDWLYGTLYKFGFANQPTSLHLNDGLALHDVYVTAALRCAPPANKPIPEELLTCRPYLLEELGLLRRLRVVVALGKIAFDAYLNSCRQLLSQGEKLPTPRPSFGHGATYGLPNGIALVASYHPSQQNTQTGRLTLEMFEDIFSSVRRMLGHG